MWDYIKLLFTPKFLLIEELRLQREALEIKRITTELQNDLINEKEGTIELLKRSVNVMEKTVGVQREHLELLEENDFLKSIDNSIN